MFKNQGSSPLDFSPKVPNNNACLNAAPQALDKLGCKSDLSAPLYQSGSKSSCSDVSVIQGVSSTSSNTSSVNWQTQVSSFTSTYSYDISGYGGVVTTAYGGGPIPTPTPTPTTCHFNQGIGNGMEGGDPGKSAPHGGSNDEGGRTPGQRWIPNIFSGLM
jgi:hypothetical protein